MATQSIDRPVEQGHPAPARGEVSTAALWFGLAGGPAAWSVQTLVNLTVASHGCFPRLDPLHEPVTSVRGIAFVVSLFAVVVCVAATAVALRSWSRTRHEHHQAAGKGSAHDTSTALMETGEGRTRFMAWAGVLASVTFLLVSVVHAASLFLVSPCGQ
jgi:hypothetical protein